MARQPPPDPNPKPPPLSMDELLNTSKKARIGGETAATPRAPTDDLPRSGGGRMRLDEGPAAHPARDSMDGLFGPQSVDRTRTRTPAASSTADDLVGGKGAAASRKSLSNSSLDDLFGPSKRR